MADQTLTPETRKILEESTFNEDGTLFILPGTLDTQVYKKIDLVLKMLGGTWKRNLKGHLFPRDIRGFFKTIMKSGIVPDMKKRRQAYYTPEEVAEAIIGNCWFENLEILEPSAGSGVFARIAKRQGAKVTCYEIDPFETENLTSQGFKTTQADFLAVTPQAIYDHVVMNPPFSKGQDMKHVDHALKFLKPGGSLYAIVSPSFKISKIREYGDFYGSANIRVETIEAGSFKESGTGIETRLLHIRNKKKTKESEKEEVEWRGQQLSISFIHGDVGRLVYKDIQNGILGEELRKRSMIQCREVTQKYYRDEQDAETEQLSISDDLLEKILITAHHKLHHYTKEDEEASQAHKKSPAKPQSAPKKEQEKPKAGNSKKWKKRLKPSERLKNTRKKEKQTPGKPTQMELFELMA